MNFFFLFFNLLLLYYFFISKFRISITRMDYEDNGLLKNCYQSFSSYTKLEKMISFTIITHIILFFILYNYLNYLMAYLRAVWLQDGIFIFYFISGIITVCKIHEYFVIKINKKIKPNHFYM